MTLQGKKIFLAGDSRSSDDYKFYKEILEEKTGADVIVGGASGWNVSRNASEATILGVLKKTTKERTAP